MTHPPSAAAGEPSAGPLGGRAEALRQTLAQHRGEKHVIALRGYPDPDSIGSAIAHAYICEHFEIEPTVLYFDDISHQENRALVKKLSIEMVRYAPGVDLRVFDGIALVDTQLVDLPGEAQDLPRISVVDHHKELSEQTAEFIDVREDSGSTCSIYAEYLEAGLAPMELAHPYCSKLASALLYGIRSDTDNYLLARGLDYRSAAFLAPFADHDLLLSVSQQSISPRTMEITQRAYANKVIVDTFLIAGVGYVRDEDRDGIGQAADYMMRREGIDTVICYGIVNNSFIDGSLRTTSAVVDPDPFIKEFLGADAHGRAFGGGRANKGAFKIPLGPLAACSERDLLWRTVQRAIEDLFFHKIGINRS